MALRLSSKVRNDMLGKKAECNNLVTGTTISFGDGTGTGGNDQILDSNNGLGDFIPGDMITVRGSASNNWTAEIKSVTAGAIDVVAGTATAEDAGAQVILGSARGGSLIDQFRNGTLRIYSGTQPAHADDAEVGTKLIDITLSSGVFTPGDPTNGINFGQIVDETLHKALGEVWSGVAAVGGTAGWFRIYGNDRTEGASKVEPRMDGAIATSGAQMNMANTTISSGGTTTIDEVDLPMAESI